MRVALVVLAAALAALAAAVVYTRAEDDRERTPGPQASATPSYEERARLAERISRSREELSAQGVYLVRTALGESCVTVSLVNPTPANRAYVERRFPGACVATQPGAIEKACGESPRGLTRDGDVTVPDLKDLGLATAAERVLAEDLTYTVRCLGEQHAEPWSPSGPQDSLLRVVAQCPSPGERVRAGTEVAIQAVAVLPGGFEYDVGALDRAATGTESPCGDGRNPRG